MSSSPQNSRGRIAVYPGSFDPITLGHEDLVRRASRLFDSVIVSIARDTGGKVPMFTFDERVAMAEDALAEYENVDVRGYSGLTVEHARKHGHQVIIRGLRAVADFEYEYQMVGMNRVLDDSIETVFLMAEAERQAIASKLVKEIARLGGDVSKFVTPEVNRALLAKLGRQ